MSRDASTDGAEVFYQPPGGAGAVGCLALVVGPPLFAVVMALYKQFGQVAGAVGLAVVLLGLLVAYAFFNEDTTVTLDARGLRLTHRKVLLGFRGQEKLAWEIPRAALTQAREVTKHTPSRSGGWNKRKQLYLPQGVVLEPALLGGDTGASYRQLLEALTRHLGERFTREEDFGPLNALKGRGGPANDPRTS